MGKDVGRNGASLARPVLALVAGTWITWRAYMDYLAGLCGCGQPAEPGTAAEETE